MFPLYLIEVLMSLIIADAIIDAIERIPNDGSNPSYDEVIKATLDVFKLYEIGYSISEEKEENRFYIFLNDGQIIKIDY